MYHFASAGGSNILEIKLKYQENLSFSCIYVPIADVGVVSVDDASQNLYGRFNIGNFQSRNKNDDNNKSTAYDNQI